MSVINKMLRDLDSRAAGPGLAQTEPGAPVVVTRGTASVAASTPPPQHASLLRFVRPWSVYAMLGLVVVVGLLWFGAGPLATWRAGRDAALTPSASPGSVAASTVPAAAVPVVAPVLEPPAVVTSASATAGPAPVASAPLADEPVFSMVPTVPPVAPSVRAPLPAPPRQELTPAETVARPTPTPPVVEVPAPGNMQAKGAVKPRVEGPAAEPANTQVPWPDAALEAVAQAQGLWNTGARESALALLRDALAGVERNHAAELPAGGPGAAAGLVMVRELVRMEMVLTHHAEVLAVLKRHERVWAGQADLWAVRGSAAQRLSQHAESAQAYLMALKVRPGEPRWMLGAAVSLAAQGQAGQAADLVEQARAISVVSPEVLAYLRQLGVPMRER